MIQNLQNQVNSLQQKVIHLEAKLFGLRTSHGASFEDNSKYALRTQNKAPESIKPMQQGDCTLKSERSEQGTRMKNKSSLGMILG